MIFMPVNTLRHRDNTRLLRLYHTQLTSLFPKLYFQDSSNQELSFHFCFETNHYLPSPPFHSAPPSPPPKNKYFTFTNSFSSLQSIIDSYSTLPLNASAEHSPLSLRIQGNYQSLIFEFQDPSEAKKKLSGRKKRRQPHHLESN